MARAGVVRKGNRAAGLVKSFVRCNDRAPARREDARDERTGGAQRSIAIAMLEYSRYCSERPGWTTPVGSLR